MRVQCLATEIPMPFLQEEIVRFLRFSHKVRYCGAPHRCNLVVNIVQCSFLSFHHVECVELTAYCHWRPNLNIRKKPIADVSQLNHERKYLQQLWMQFDTVYYRLDVSFMPYASHFTFCATFIIVSLLLPLLLFIYIFSTISVFNIGLILQPTINNIGYQLY